MSQVEETLDGAERHIWEKFISQNNTMRVFNPGNFYRQFEFDSWLQNKLVNFVYDEGKDSAMIDAFFDQVKGKWSESENFQKGRKRACLLYALVMYVCDYAEDESLHLKENKVNDVIKKSLLAARENTPSDLLWHVREDLLEAAHCKLLADFHPKNEEDKPFDVDQFKAAWDHYPHFASRYEERNQQKKCLEFEIYNMSKALRKNCPHMISNQKQSSSEQNHPKEVKGSNSNGPVHTQTEDFDKIVPWYLDAVLPTRMKYSQHLDTTPLDHVYVTPAVMQKYFSQRHLSKSDIETLVSHCVGALGSLVDNYNPKVYLQETHCQILEKWVDNLFVLFCKDVLQWWTHTNVKSGQSFHHADFYARLSFAFPVMYAQYYGYRNLVCAIVEQCTKTQGLENSGNDQPGTANPLDGRFLQRPFFLPESYDSCDTLLAFYYSEEQRKLWTDKNLGSTLCQALRSFLFENRKVDWSAVCNPVYGHLRFFLQHGTKNRSYVEQFLKQSTQTKVGEKTKGNGEVCHSVVPFASVSKTIFLENLFEEYMDQRYVKDGNTRLISEKDMLAQKKIFIQYVIPEWLRGCDCLAAWQTPGARFTSTDYPWKKMPSLQDWIVHCGYSVYATFMYHWIAAQHSLQTNRGDSPFVVCPFPTKPNEYVPDLWQNMYILHVASVKSSDKGMTQEEYEKKNLNSLIKQLIDAWGTHANKRYEAASLIKWGDLGDQVQHIFLSRHPKVGMAISKGFTIEWEQSLVPYQSCQNAKNNTPKGKQSLSDQVWEKIKETWEVDEPCLQAIVSHFPENRESIHHLSPVQFWSQLFGEKGVQDMNERGTLWEKREQLYYLYLYMHQFQYVSVTELHLYWPSVESRRPYIPHTAIQQLKDGEREALKKKLTKHLQDGDYLGVSYRRAPDTFKEVDILANEILHCCRYLGTCWFAPDLLAFYLQPPQSQDSSGSGDPHSLVKTERELMHHLSVCLHQAFPLAYPKDVGDFLVFHRPDIMMDVVVDAPSAPTATIPPKFATVEEKAKCKEVLSSYLTQLFQEQEKRSSLGESIFLVQTALPAEHLEDAKNTCYYDLTSYHRRHKIFESLNGKTDEVKETKGKTPFLFYSQCEMRDHVSYLTQEHWEKDLLVPDDPKRTELVKLIVQDVVSWDPAHQWTVYWEHTVSDLKCPDSSKNVERHFSLYLKKGANSIKTEDYNCGGEFKAPVVQQGSKQLPIRNVDKMDISFASNKESTATKTFSTEEKSMINQLASGIFDLSVATLRFAFGVMGAGLYHVLQGLHSANRNRTRDLLVHIEGGDTQAATTNKQTDPLVSTEPPTSVSTDNATSKLEGLPKHRNPKQVPPISTTQGKSQGHPQSQATVAARTSPRVTGSAVPDHKQPQPRVEPQPKPIHPVKSEEEVSKKDVNSLLQVPRVSHTNPLNALPDVGERTAAFLTMPGSNYTGMSRQPPSKSKPNLVQPSSPRQLKTEKKDSSSVVSSAFLLQAIQKPSTNSNVKQEGDEEKDKDKERDKEKDKEKTGEKKEPKTRVAKKKGGK